jgi:carbonic anhydrase
MRKLAIALSISLAFISANAFAEGTADPQQMLMDGNARYVSGEAAKKDISSEKRMSLVNGQKPYAIVLTCSDSRVPPELIFDEGLGQLFVIRVAGNVIDPVTLGSIEYAAEHLKTPLLIIMGHSNCGAVKSALEAKGKLEGNLGELVNKVLPAVKKANAAGKKDASETLDIAVQENIKNMYAETMKSKVVKELSEEGKLKVITAEYYLDSGKVVPVEVEKEHVKAAKAE